MKKEYLLCAVLTLLLTACSHTYYAPNIVPTPHLMDKGNADLRVNLISPVGQSSDFTAFEFSGTYSPVKHLAVMSNIFYGAASKSNGKNNGYIWDLAAGGYLPLNLNKEKIANRREELCLSGFLGTSFGGAYNTFDTIGNVYSRLIFNKYFASASVSYLVQRFKLGFGLRYNYLQYSSRSKNNGPIPSDELRSIANIESQTNFSFPEMSLSLGLDLRKVYFVWGLTRCYVSQPQLYNFNNSNVFMTMGVNLHEFFKK